MKSILAVILVVANFALDDVILDIYNAVSEFSEVEFEQLQSDLYAFHEQPIDLNSTSEEELSQLYFLSPRQIDDILVYADNHPFESLYELRMIPSLSDFEIRDLLPFVRVSSQQSGIGSQTMYPKEVFVKASHEVLTRIDARNIEGFDETDPVYVQGRYRFDFQRRVVFGAQLRRPAGGEAKDLQYGAYLQLRDLGHLHSLVAGNFQASFGQGLVFAPTFHSGKSMYVTSAGQTREGLRYYSSVDGEGLHGLGATLRWNWGKATRLDVSALYSMSHANDSTWRHVLGANVTMRHRRLEVQLTAAESLWSDSIRPYNNAAYNEHYFRGYRQAVLGASVRYNHGWFDVFGEVAAAQNRERWGAGVLLGSRFYPTDGVALTALYRYYSPYFDNPLGYAFSETSRMNDENGGYLGWDITRLSHWRFSGYADVYYFSGVKYGIPQARTMGYDAMLETQYNRSQWQISGRVRARKKGDLNTYSARFQYNHEYGPWSFRTTADGNMCHGDGLAVSGYGVSLAQDFAFDCTQYTAHKTPLSFKLRLQAFDARNWNNRIYLYEHDVLYAFSIPATYGLGGRAYLCVKWQAHEHVAVYLRVSETVYEKNWAQTHNRSQTRTDVHALLRCRF